MGDGESCLGNSRFAMAAFSTLSTVFSFTGNMVLFITILRHRSLHTNLNRLVLSTTAADILSTLSSQPMDIAHMISFPNYPFTPVGYIIWHSIYNSYLTLSACNLCIMNLDRLIAVRFPLRYNSMMTRKVINSLICACWLYGAITFGLITYLQLSNHTKLSEFKYLILIPRKWIVLFYITNVSLPTLISFLASLYVTRIAWKRKKQIDQLTARFTTPTLESDVQSGSIFQYSRQLSDAKESSTKHQLALISCPKSSSKVLQPKFRSRVTCSSMMPEMSTQLHGVISPSKLERAFVCGKSGSRVALEQATSSADISFSRGQEQISHSKEVNTSKNPHQVIRNRTKIGKSRKYSTIVASKTSRLVLVLSVTFCVCTFPYIVMDIYGRYSTGPSFKQCWFQLTEIVAWWMTYWNSIINVLCYLSMNTQLRSALKRNLFAIKTWFI